MQHEAAPSARPRLAGVHDLQEAAATLAAAFADYPWTRYVIPTEGAAERLLELQQLYLTHAQQHGFVGVAEGGSGAVALLPPDAPAPSADVVERIVTLHGDRIDRLSDAGTIPGAWRLETLGVRPEAQGRGVGGELVRFAIAEAARRGAVEFMLETSDPRNVRLYQRHGFETVAHRHDEGAPPVWTMRRST